jgi:hypothetical protein
MRSTELTEAAVDVDSTECVEAIDEELLSQLTLSDHTYCCASDICMSKALKLKGESVL